MSAPEAMKTPGPFAIARSLQRRGGGVRELLHERLDRIRAQAKLNAVVTLDPKSEERAEAADHALANGISWGPLHGVPFTVKDTIDVAGLRATAGSAVLADRVAASTAPAVQRLLDAGAILLGKTNCSEFAVDVHTANPLFGDTWNPWDLTRTPGGSSGGEAAAVASGISAFGVGTDFGGSVRFPAHCTGICALRPTVGVIPGTGVLPAFPDNTRGIPNPSLMLHRLMTIGPLAPTAKSLAKLLKIMAGPDGSDASTVPIGLKDPEEVALADLSVAWCDGEGSIPTAADVRATVAAAADALRGKVHRVVESRPPGLEAAAALFARAADAEGMPEAVALVAGKERLLGEFFRDYLARVASPAPFGEICRLGQRCVALRAKVLAHFAAYPILLLPVAAVPAPRPGASAVIDGTRVAWGDIGACCRAISVLGLPSASVAFGWSEGRLPIGVQIVGRPFHDHEVLAIAVALEAARPARKS